MEGIVRSGKVEPAPEWKEETKGKYVSFRDELTHTLTFVNDEPVKEMLNINGKDKMSYQWPVTEAGVERILSVTSVRLLGLLAKQKALKGCTFVVTYEPIQRLYSVLTAK